MPGLEIINKDQHKGIRIITERGSEYGENIHFVPVIADEVRSLATEYPVFFMKDSETGQFGLNALLGFDEGENLFLDGEEWRANYLPVHIRRQPFMVGMQGSGVRGADSSKGSLALNTDHPRVSNSRGEALFSEDGEPTHFLKNMGELVSRLMGGSQATATFVQALLDADLIAPTQLEVKLRGDVRRFDGLYTIKEENLSKLTGDTLQEYFSKGYLQACYMQLASVANIQKLVAMYDDRGANS